mmetsp:Transcript_36437/g.104964  ORF Transcript_36437/g.104964 Transcript_36437/m.104964 type:complete len:489 (-) Transcript_36437:251-1717(-)
MSNEGGSNAAGAVPSPLTVGKHFVKQYYQVLQSNADQIFRFYQPTSFLSHAEGSNPTDPSGLENYDIAARWGIIGTESKGFAMEIGAIDAQTSIDNSILLVVTGSVSGSAKDERKTFIHTFFLTYIPNTKRFYVANDVLRFLEKTQSKEAGPIEEAENETHNKEETVVEEALAPTAVEEPTPAIPAVEEASPGGGVEETKEVEIGDETPAEPVVEPAAVATETPVVVESKEESPKAAAGGKDGVSGNKGKRGKGKVTQQQPKQQPASKPTPGSWASLVASSPAVASPPVPPSPAKPATAEKPETAEKAPAPVSAPAPKSKEAASKDSGKGGQRGADRHKRDPDCTLVIKNLPDSAKDSDLLALFEGFATSTGGKILGTTVSVHRGLGFVDYDSVAPVLAAVAKHQEHPLELNGRVLDIDQKTAEQRTRRNTRGGGGGGGYRSGSPGNGGAYRGGGGSGGAGRQNQFRRGNNERGDRGGGGRGGGRGNK